MLFCCCVRTNIRIPLCLGAGAAVANGVYRQGSDKRWTNGHREIYLVNFPVSALPEWHLAHEGVVGSVLYINRNPLAMKAAGNMPPSWGWIVGMNIIGIGLN